MVFPFDVLNAQPLLVGKVGSHAYGTATAESDDDYMGVILAPISCYTGLNTWSNDGTYELKRANNQEVDAVFYELQKFFKLCLGFNPNVIPLLYLDQYEIVSPAGQLLLDNRDMFVSKRAFHTFVGYAKAQLINVERGVTGKYGAKRKALIEKYGYDVKFAYHTIRLLLMIARFFETREMNVNMGVHIPMLMDIREGKISKDGFFSMATALMLVVERSFNNATWLPEKPDQEKANNICMEIVEENKFVC